MRILLVKSNSWWAVEGNRQCSYRSKRTAELRYRNGFKSDITEHETINMEVASDWPESMVVKSREVA